jgi:hypothetical protein
MSIDPVKISKQPGGLYRWSCPIEVEYHRNSIRPGFYACIGIAVFLLIFGGVLSISYHDLKSFFVVTGCTAVFLLITFLVFGLAFSATDPHESYEMTETFVHSGYGKSSVYFDFKKVKTIVLGGKYIELRGKTKRMRIYVPEEDYDFVRSFIQVRVPMECEIRKESF